MKKFFISCFGLATLDTSTSNAIPRITFGNRRISFDILETLESSQLELILHVVVLVAKYTKGMVICCSLGSANLFRKYFLSFCCVSMIIIGHCRKVFNKVTFIVITKNKFFLQNN